MSDRRRARPAPETPFARQVRDLYSACLKPGGGKDIDLIYAVNEDCQKSIAAGRLVGQLAAEAAAQASAFVAPVVSEPTWPAASPVRVTGAAHAETIVAAARARGPVSPAAQSAREMLGLPSERERGRMAFAKAMGKTPDGAGRVGSAEYERGRAAALRAPGRSPDGARPTGSPDFEAGHAAFASAFGKTPDGAPRAGSEEFEKGRAALAHLVPKESL